MFFRQLLNDPIAQASYIVGCPASGEAAVVDPSLPAEQYALAAVDRGLRITAVLETHMHADYFSTGRALARLTGATIYAPRIADIRFPHHPLDDGDVVPVGNVRIRALHTPGHTPEHMCYLVTDTRRSEEVWFALTGDCLFVGDVGRADLVDLPLTGPDHLYDSIFGRLLALPDAVEIYPAHYGGSACGGKSMSGKISSTIGFERRFNWVLQAGDREGFREAVSETARQAVEAVLLHRNTNRGELPLPADYYDSHQPEPSAGPPVVRALSPKAAAAALRTGAALIDVRPQLEFAAGHPAGAINVPFGRDTLVSRTAALTARDEALVVVADQPFAAQTAAAMLAGAGRNPVLGYVGGAPDDWRQAGVAVDTLPLLSLAELHARANDGESVIVDVRDPYEWEKGVIPGAHLIRLAELRDRLGELPREAPIVVVCESGTRAGAAASALRRNGYARVFNVAPDGMSDYARRYPTVMPVGSAQAGEPA